MRLHKIKVTCIIPRFNYIILVVKENKHSSILIKQLLIREFFWFQKWLENFFWIVKFLDRVCFICIYWEYHNTCLKLEHIFAPLLNLKKQGYIKLDYFISVPEIVNYLVFVFQFLMRWKRPCKSQPSVEFTADFGTQKSLDVGKTHILVSKSVVH